MAPTRQDSLRAATLIRASSFSSYAFEDPSSPESVALQLVRWTDDLESTSNGKILQKYAIAVLMFTWGLSSNSSTFLSHVGSECEVNGITCDNNGNVNGITWPSLNLSGTIPADIGLLTSLELLNVANNGITSTFPISFFRLTSLQHLYMQNNALIGEIPWQIGAFGRLRNLLLGDNHMTGTVLEKIAHLESLGTYRPVELFAANDGNIYRHQSGSACMTINSRKSSQMLGCSGPIFIR